MSKTPPNLVAKIDNQNFGTALNAWLGDTLMNLQLESVVSLLSDCLGLVAESILVAEVLVTEELTEYRILTFHFATWIN